MPRKSPYVLELTAEQRRELELEFVAIGCRIGTWCGPSVLGDDDSGRATASALTELHAIEAEAAGGDGTEPGHRQGEYGR